ncbi:uncharacterized protein LOC128965335 [Oppia nitens]|uniref:uncharacterized protein LOC128965335 n=1 Tax=Oppia nitens TaxID=1686743 RepID=UPI0023D9E67A|nr:uncharacterized protein LOC128965335 [Oppia nitens]
MNNISRKTKFNRNFFFTRSESRYDKDKRQLSNHRSYHIGRFFSLIGSAIIVCGLFCKFIFTKDIESKIPIITVCVATFGAAVMLVGIGFLAFAVYKAQIAIVKQSADGGSVNAIPGSSSAGGSQMSNSSNSIDTIPRDPTKTDTVSISVINSIIRGNR